MEAYHVLFILDSLEAINHVAFEKEVLNVQRLKLYFCPISARGLELMIGGVQTHLFILQFK